MNGPAMLKSRTRSFPALAGANPVAVVAGRSCEHLVRQLVVLHPGHRNKPRVLAIRSAGDEPLVSDKQTAVAALGCGARDVSIERLVRIGGTGSGGGMCWSGLRCGVWGGAPATRRGRSPSGSSGDMPSGRYGASMQPSYQVILTGGMDPRAGKSNRMTERFGNVNELLPSFFMHSTLGGGAEPAAPCSELRGYGRPCRRARRIRSRKIRAS